MEEGRNVKWADISACSHCSHIDRRDDEDTFYCMNPLSPYNPENSYQGVPLSDMEWIKGCHEINYRGRKIDEDAFEFVPKDSILRKIVEKVLENPEDVHEGHYTSEDLATVFKRAKRREKEKYRRRTFEFEDRDIPRY